MELSGRLQRWLELRADCISAVQAALNAANKISHVSAAKTSDAGQMSELLLERDGSIKRMRNVQKDMVRAVESLVEVVALGQSNQLAVEPLLVASIVDQIQKQQTLEMCIADRTVRRLQENDTNADTTTSLLTSLSHPPYLNLDEVQLLVRALE